MVLIKEHELKHIDLWYFFPFKLSKYLNFFTQNHHSFESFGSQILPSILFNFSPQPHSDLQSPLRLALRFKIENCYFSFTLYAFLDIQNIIISKLTKEEMEILSMEIFESGFEKENQYASLNRQSAPLRPSRAMLSDITKLHVPKKTTKTANASN